MNWLEVLILAGVAIAGYRNASAWWWIAGAGVLTIDSWWTKLKQLRHDPAIPASTKKTTYFVASVVSHFVFAAGSYLAGYALGRLMQG